MEGRPRYETKEVWVEPDEAAMLAYISVLNNEMLWLANRLNERERLIAQAYESMVTGVRGAIEEEMKRIHEAYTRDLIETPKVEY